MKKILLLTLALCLGASLFADEILVYSGDGYVYNDMMKSMTDRQFAIKYDTDEDIYYFQFADYLERAWFHMAPSEIEHIRSILEKYLEWEKTAVENNVKIEKQIPDSLITGELTWRFGDDTWLFGKDFKIAFTFFSQTEEHHQLVIMSNEVKATNNNFYDYKIENHYLMKGQVENFLEGISPESVEGVLAEYNASKNAESLFN